MEIKGVSQSCYYVAEQSDTNKKNEPLKGIASTLNYLNQFLISKVDKEKIFTKISPKEDTYTLDCRSVARGISDLNVPLCDTTGGAG